MKVVPVPVRSDNYAYLLVDQASNTAAAVDPFDVPKVVQAAESLGVTIVAALTTHHHLDHSGGNAEFAAKFPNARIYGGSTQIPAMTDQVSDKQELKLGTNTHIRCLATPCHTQDSICYYATNTADSSEPGQVFTGDTLFIAGCGKFFEGTGAEMVSALTYLGSLPNNTVVNVGHEYTADNLAFASSVDPENKAFERLSDLVKNHKITTSITTIGDEKEWNVFMHVDSDVIRRATSLNSDTPTSAVMDALREKKNRFKK